MPSSKALCCVYEVPGPYALTASPPDARLPDSVRHPTFLFVGRMIRSKGLQALLHACKLLVETGLDQFSVLPVGDGIHREKLQELADQLNVSDHIIWRGQVDYQHLGAYYQSCDVFVLPSFEDTWGVVVLEAMAFGRPVICSKYAGVQEVVRHGVNGFVIDPHDPGELARHMERFIRQPGLAAQFGAISQEAAAAWTPVKVAWVLEDVIYKALASTQPAL